MKSRGLLVVLSGPAGSGKSTIADAFVKAAGDEVLKAITATTRRPRTGEVDGRDYYFITREKFEQGLRENRFIEHNEFNGNFYGTPRDMLEQSLSRGKVVILVIDVNGSAAIRNCFRNVVHIFVLPPTPAELCHRLRGRGTERVSEIEARLKIAEAEVARMEEYDHLVINDLLDGAVADLAAIVNVVRAHHIRGGECEAWRNNAYQDWHADRPDLKP
jgi:guanylate kinase